MANREDIEQKVIEVVTETLALNSPAKLSDSFKEDLDADSIDLVTLVVALQDELKSTFDVNDIQNRSTLREMVDFIEMIQKQGPAPA